MESERPTLPRALAAELKNLARGGDARASDDLLRAIEAYSGEDFTTAAAAAERAKQRAPRSPSVRELLGLALYNGGAYRDALRELQAFRRLAGRADQNHLIADCYRALGRPERAIETCLEVHPGDVADDVWTETVIVAASAMADTGDVDKALSHLARAELEPALVRPHHLRLWYVRADLFERAGKVREAREVWERLMAEDRDFYDVGERFTRSTRLSS